MVKTILILLYVWSGSHHGGPAITAFHGPEAPAQCIAAKEALLRYNKQGLFIGNINEVSCIDASY